jgi:hypothetical protein
MLAPRASSGKPRTPSAAPAPFPPPSDGPRARARAPHSGAAGARGRPRRLGRPRRRRSARAAGARAGPCLSPWCPAPPRHWRRPARRRRGPPCAWTRQRQGRDAGAAPPASPAPTPAQCAPLRRPNRAPCSTLSHTDTHGERRTAFRKCGRAHVCVGLARVWMGGWGVCGAPGCGTPANHRRLHQTCPLCARPARVSLPAHVYTLA